MVNGEALELAGPLSVSELLARLEIDPRRVAVEHNLTVLKRGTFDTTQVGDGDEIEIVNFVGGGQQIGHANCVSSINVFGASGGGPD